MLAVVVATALHLQTPRFADPDGFYHFRHAWLYTQHGPLYSSFPWVSASVISQWQADLWYGFHLLLAPLALFANSPAGIKLCGTFLLSLMLWLFFVFCRRERLAFPFLWPFLLLFAAPPALWGWLSIRPQLLSTPLFALLLSIFCRGTARQVALCVFAMVWLHTTLFWMAPVILVVAFGTRGLAEKVWAWREAGAGLLGLLLALILRPEPIKAARLLYVQIIELAQVKQRGLPLSWASELSRLSNELLITDYLPFLLLWLSGIVFLLYALLVRRLGVPPERRALLWSSLALSVIFFQFSSLFSARAVLTWICFGMVFVAVVFSMYVSSAELPKEKLAPAFRQSFAAVGALIVLWMTGLSLPKTHEGLNQAAIEADRLKPAMDWLKANSRPGEIVFHVNWALFPEMFFWNQHNRFIGGMDPIFQYAYNPDLYWMSHRLETGLFSDFTSPSPPGTPDEKAVKADTYTALTRDFKATYLILIKAGTPRLYDHASRDSRFHLAYDSETVAVFRL